MLPINFDIDTDIHITLDKFINIINCDSYNIKNILNNLKKKIKLDDSNTGTILPKQLDDKNFIIMLKDKNSNEILSFIWYGFYYNDNFGTILNVNFSFTFNKFRNNGFNKLLRLELEKIAILNNIQYITSVPFENSSSKKILINLGYVSEQNYFYKKIF